MTGDVKDAMEQSGFLQVIEIGIPCKYSETALIPKFIWDYIENEIIGVCRGGERVLLEMVAILDEGELNRESNAMFNISGKEYVKIWNKRLLHEVDGGWCKVKMHKI